jgi:glycerol-3-phosphate acyltransferase PlsY
VTGPSFLQLVVPALFAYFIGGLPFGYLFVRLTLGQDVRTLGSGNIGATNVHRSAGGTAGLVVLLLDIAKGLLAVWLAAISSHHNAGAIALAWICVMLGHCFPLFLGFKGGKAVAAFIGAALYIAPVALLAAASIFVLAVALSRYVSLGSIVGVLVFPLMMWVVYRPPGPLLVAAIAAAVLIIVRHQGNIERLRSGTETPFALKGGSAK